MYKIIQNNKVVDVVNVPQFIKFLSSGHISFTDKASAQGIVGSDNETIYSFKPEPRYGSNTATIEKITSEEFNRLRSLLNSSQEVCADLSTLIAAKTAVINRLSNTCKSKITAGFYITLSDGELYHFKLTTEDQLNLMNIENQLNTGSTSFVYHATDKPCQIFTREDMLRIISAFRRYTLYHTTYFNAAKHYVNSLVDLEKVRSFTYGTDVSGTVEDAVLRQILKNGGNVE